MRPIAKVSEWDNQRIGYEDAAGNGYVLHTGKFTGRQVWQNGMQWPERVPLTPEEFQEELACERARIGVINATHVSGSQYWVSGAFQQPTGKWTPTTGDFGQKTQHAGAYDTKEEAIAVADVIRRQLFDKRVEQLSNELHNIGIDPKVQVAFKPTTGEP